MSTTIAPDAPASDALHPQSEDDKLGPFGAKASSLHEPGELRARLLGAFHDAVLGARHAVLEVEIDSPRAVHDARKALRRARAALSMLAGALPRSERRAVKAALQEARRSLSTARDHTVAPETLGHLDLDGEDHETARRVVDNAAEAIPAAAEIKQLLGEAAARAAAQGEALEAALPAGIPFEVMIDGITAVYAEARRARRRGKQSRAWFHTWRRRTKELVYQLDFISGLAGARTLAIRAEVDGVADLLSPAVDLVMLREFVDTHGQGIAASAVADLRDTIDAQLEDLMKTGRKTARDAFRQKPKKFARRLTRAVKRDLTPADDNGRDSDDGALADA